MRSSILTVLALAALLPGSASALTLREAMQTALDENPGLDAADEMLVQARIGRDRAWSFIQPQFSLGGQFRINDREIALDSEALGGDGLTTAFTGLYENLGFIYGKMFENGMIDLGDDCDTLAEINGFADCNELIDVMLEGGELGTTDPGTAEPIVIQPKTQLFLSANLTWPLSPRVIPLVRAGNRQIEATQAQQGIAREQLLGGVMAAYAGAWGAQQAVELLRDQVALLDRHVEQVEVLLANEVATEDVLMRARLEASRVRRQLVETESGERSARRGLAVAMGVPASSLGELAAPAGVEPVDQADHYLSQAEGRRDITAAEAMLAASRELGVDAGLAFLPQFAVTGNWSWTDQSAGFDGQQSSWYIGLGLNIPIWDGGTNLHNAREAASRRRQAEAQLESTRQQAAVLIEDAFDAWQVARSDVPVAAAEAELAAETLRLVQVRFDADTATQLEVLDARAAHQAAQLSLLQAQVQEQLAAGQLLLATGEISVDVLAGN